MLLKIYLKELKDTFRDRRTLLLTVILPLLMMTGLTFFYEQLVSSGEEEKYTLAVDSSFSDEEKELFSIYDNIEFAKSSNPEKMFQEGDAQAALLLSSDFVNSVQAGKEAHVTIIGDSFSQKSSSLINMITTSLTSYEKTIVAERLQAQGTNPTLLEPFTVEQKEMSEEEASTNVIAMLIPLVLILSITIGASPAALDLFAGEKEKKTMEALLLTPVNRSTLLVAKWLTISTVGSLTGIISLMIVAVEISFFTENLKKAISFGNDVYLIITFAFIASVIYAMLVASMLMLTSIIGKTVKEAQSYSSPIMMLTMLPMMFISTLGVNEFSFYHFAIPVLNLFSLLKELVFGIINYEHIIVASASNLICMIMIFIVGRVLFMKDKWVMN
ncbi:ABC transporter permease [Bacillus sp. JJ722]|uniref:ABC transporter permease n=1 Tax=Bacillus sp. JJ722 TaxID=3122973 RepID=UPI002FFE9900